MMSQSVLSIKSWESDHGSEYLSRSQADQKFMKQFQDEDQLQDQESLSTYKDSLSSKTSMSGKSVTKLSLASSRSSMENKVFAPLKNSHHINNLK
jgi:hypothetical protein